VPVTIDWVAAAKTVARAYIDYSYTLRAEMSLDYDLEIRWTTDTHVVKKVMFQSNLDGLYYEVTIEKTGPGERDMQCTIQPIKKE